MEDPSAENPIIALSAWLDTPTGRYVRDWEQARLDELTADIFGFNALQIGMPQIEALRANRMPCKWQSDADVAELVAVATGVKDEGDEGSGGRNPVRVAVTHDFAELPFATQSIDLIVLPHVLEFAEEPHHVLREVDRVLIPEGQVIICGFNPASLWGARQGLGRLSGVHFLPADGEFISVPRLKDWLTLLDMEVNRGHFGCYAPPYTSETWLRRFSFMEKAGDRWWPYLGAVYIVQAIKRVRGMHLIGPAWRKEKADAKRGVPAAGKGR